MDRRMSRGPFFGILAALLLAQVFLVVNTTGLGAREASALPTVLGVVGVLLLQLLKLPITAWRLNDIGRPASDALFFVLLPIGNIVGLGRYMVENTPTEKQWAWRRRAWASQLGPVEALGQALGLAAKTAHVVLPVVLLYGIVMAVVGSWALGWLDWASEAGAETRTWVGQALTVVVVLLGVYSIVQAVKRRKASRMSWLPSLFLGPLVLLTLCFTLFEQGVEANMQILLLQGVYVAWQMLWMSFGGAAVVVASTLAAEKIRKGEPLQAGAVLGQVGPRTLDVAGPHGAKIQAVTIGLQILIPGIFYMLALAFVDTISVLKPKAAALSESMTLTWGMRARLFKLLLAVGVATTVLHFVTLVSIEALPLPMNQGTPPELVEAPAARLSPGALTEGKTGTVRIRVDVNEVGKVVGSGFVDKVTTELDDAAERAALSATFLPAEKRGRPLAVSAVLSFPFERTPTTKASIDSVEFPNAAAAVLAYFIDPRDLSLLAFAVGEVLWGISFWIVQLALLQLYHDRVGYLETRREERKRKRKREAPERVPCAECGTLLEPSALSSSARLVCESCKAPPEIPKRSILNGGPVVGAIAMVVAVVVFVVGLMDDVLLFYPPFLFVLGLGGFLHGIFNRK